MKITRNNNLNEIGFKKYSPFPIKERRKIIKAIENLQFKDFDDYSKNFETKLAKELPGTYIQEQRVFKDIKSKCKNGKSFQYKIDFYNPKLKIAIEVEKTKTTTLLLDVIKFIMGYKRKKDGKPIIEYGVLIIPDRYRNKNRPNSQGDTHYNRVTNELAFINSILWIKDILLVEYDTQEYFE